MMLVAFFTVMPALLAVAIYTFLTIYAVVKGIGSAPDSADALAVLMGIVAIVTAFLTLVGVGVYLIGRDREKPIVPGWLRRSDHERQNSPSSPRS